MWRENTDTLMDVAVNNYDIFDGCYASNNDMSTACSHCLIKKWHTSNEERAQRSQRELWLIIMTFLTGSMLVIMIYIKSLPSLIQKGINTNDLERAHS